MKKLLYIIPILIFCLSAFSQPMPIMRNAMTTNVAGTPVLSRADLSVTNVGSATNWLFYGQAPNTVARLTDIIAAGINAATATGIIQGFGPNMFILITNGVGTNTTFSGSNDATIALRANGPVVVSNDMRGAWAGLYVTGTNGGLYVDGGDGDITGNGTTSVADQIAIENWIYLAAASDTYLTNYAARARADIDGNGWIDFNDWALVQHAIAGADLPDLRRRFQRSEGSVFGVDTNENFIIGTRQLVLGSRLYGAGKLELINTNNAIPDFMINTNKFWITNGIVKVDGSGEGRSVDPRVVILRNIDSGSGNAHAFSDSSTISARPGIGYNSYDARILYSGTQNYDHYACFQFSPAYNSSGWMKNMYGMFSLPVITNGIISNLYGIYLDNPTVAAPGAVSNCYWMRIVASNIGALTNFAILQEGAIPSYFEGPMYHDGQTFMRGTVMIGTNTGPSKTLEVQRGNGTEPGIRLRQIGQNFWDIVIPASGTRLDISDVSAATYGPYVTVLNGGFFGLMTNNPQARLHVKGSAIIETNLAVKGSNYVAGQSYFANTVYIDGTGSGLEVDGLTVTNGITNFGALLIPTNANEGYIWTCTNTTTGQGTWKPNNVAYGQTWYVWGSSNAIATNAAGTPYKAMWKSDVTIPATANTNTYVNPSVGSYVAEVITAIPAGIASINPGDINTVSFMYLNAVGSVTLQAEIYIRTNNLSPDWTLSEREIGVGPTFVVNNVTPPSSYTSVVPITTNVSVLTTSYLVRKYKVIANGSSRNVSFVSQGSYPARVTFPIGSANFVLKSGDTMQGTLVLTNSYNRGTAFSSPWTNIGSEQFGTNSHAYSNYSLAIGNNAQAIAGTSIAIGFGPDVEGTNGIGIGFQATVDLGKSNSIAIGTSADATTHRSVALGDHAQTDTDDQIMMGTSSIAVKVPGFLELPIGAAVGSMWQCTNATTGRGEWNASKYRTIWIDAGAMMTNGLSAGPSTALYSPTNGNNPCMDVWDFDSATPETNFFKLMMPDSWDLGTVKVKFFYFATDVSANNSNIWGVTAMAVSGGDLIDLNSYGTEVLVTNVVQNATNKLNSCISPALTIGGTPALGDMVIFKLRRSAGAGYGGLGDVRLTGVAIQWKDNNSNPVVW